MPKTVALPLLASNRPVNIEIVVVFPAPLCPSKAKIYPLYIVILVSSTATLSPNTFLKPRIFKHSFDYSCLLRTSGTASKSKTFLPSSISTESFKSEALFSSFVVLAGLLLLHQNPLVHKKFHFLATPY